MNRDEIKRLRQLEHENARLKNLLVERDLEIKTMREINAKVVAQSELEPIISELENIATTLDHFNQMPQTNEVIVRGYKVKVTWLSIFSADMYKRRNNVAEVIAKSISRQCNVNYLQLK